MTTTKISYPEKAQRASITQEQTWIRWTLIGLALTFLALFLFVPLVPYFTKRLKKVPMFILPPLLNPMRVRPSGLL